jgi:signal transduction histidine kinase
MTKMELIFANLLRGAVTNILNILLISSLVEFKYSKKVAIITFVATCSLITIITSYFCIFYDVTTYARFDLVIWILLGAGSKFLFKDSIMKWLFNLITVLNVFFVVIVISYVVARPLPYPMYANTVVRIILYTILIILFKKFVHPLYRQVVDKWRLFLALAVGIMLNYIYILIASKNIARAITQNLMLIVLLTVLMFIVYGTMLWSFQSIIREYRFITEKEQMRLHQELLYSQLSAYEEFVEGSKRHRHDLRHHNQIIMEYLKDGDVKGAEEYLHLYDASLIESAARNYCKNHIANAVLCLYSQKAQAEEIIFAANADIPESIAMTPPELGSMLSNILENALEACRKTKTDGRFITFTAEVEDDVLKIELKNTVIGEVGIKNNLPVSTKKNGGTGTKSVLHIVENYHGMLNFRQEEDTFITQIILPA